MKFFRSLITMMSLVICGQAWADFTPSKVIVNFQKIYAPDGFDDNDNVQLVGEGMFSNSCYRNAETTIQVNQETRTISLGPVAYRYNGMCLQLVLPFDRVMDVGILKKGNYSIVEELGGRVLGHINITAAKVAEPDDYLYAPISQAFFTSKNSVNKLYLMGDFTLSCMKLKEVRTQVQADVMVIQPIAEIDPAVRCLPGKFHFDQETNIPSVKVGRYLLHVRSMNGKSVNSLVDVE